MKNCTIKVGFIKIILHKDESQEEKVELSMLGGKETQYNQVQDQEDIVYPQQVRDPSR